MIIRIRKNEKTTSPSRKRLGEISMYNNVFKPSPVWKLEREYSNITYGRKARGNITKKELRRIGSK